MGDMIDFYADHAIDYVESLRKQIREEQEKCNRLRREASAGGVQQILQYPLPYGVTKYNSPELARAAIREVMRQAVETKAANDKAIAANAAIYAEAVAYLTNLGLKPETRKWNGRKRKTVTEPSDWTLLIGTQIPRADGRNEFDTKVKSLLHECDVRESDAKKAAEMEQRMIEQDRKRKERDATVAVLGSKYGLPLTVEYNEVLAAILEKDKYLRLAHWMERNREDWNDGSHYADIGLRTFAVETDQDREVYRDIDGYITDWEGDGRIFRDCEWNYSRLFEIAREREPEVFLDYCKLIGLGEE